MTQIQKSTTRRMSEEDKNGTGAIVNQAGQVETPPPKAEGSDGFVTVRQGGQKYWFQPSEGAVISCRLLNRITIPPKGDRAQPTVEYLVEALGPATVRGSEATDIHTTKTGEQFYITERYSIAELKTWGPGMTVRLTWLGKRKAKAGRTVWDVKIEGIGKEIKERALALAAMRPVLQLAASTFEMPAETETEPGEDSEETPF